MNFWSISGLELEGGAQGEVAEMVNFLSVDTLFAPLPCSSWRALEGHASPWSSCALWCVQACSCVFTSFDPSLALGYLIVLRCILFPPCLQC